MRRMSASMDQIRIRGARQHNLRNVSCDIPRNRLVVITGVSGSGKSSLAFDTIFAEGQRRYVESLSAYARQFLEQMEKPDVDSIEGLSPAISIEQRTTSRNPRSTVGTVTEIYDYLRLLYASIGIPHCTSCGHEIGPPLFSFTSPYGACPRCSGLGMLLEIDERKIVPDPSKSIEDGAIALWKEGAENWRVKQIHTLAKHYRFSLTAPWNSLPEKGRNCILYGSEDKIKFEFQGDASAYHYTGTYEGIVPMLQRRYHESDSEDVREEIERFMTPTKCPECNGRRLKPEALAVTVANEAIDQIVKRQLKDAADFFRTIELTAREEQIDGKI